MSAVSIGGFAFVVVVGDLHRVRVMAILLMVAERHAHACRDCRCPLHGDDGGQGGYEDPGEPKKHWSIVSQQV